MLFATVTVDCPVMVNTAKVFVPVMAHEPAAGATVTVEYVNPPPMKVLVTPTAALPVNAMIDELALKVKFVVVVMSHVLPAPVALKVHVPLPIFKLRVPLPVPLKAAAAVNVGLLLFTLQSKMHPVVDAVHAPIVIDCHVGL